MLGLCAHDPLPGWVTHVASPDGSTVWTGTRAAWENQRGPAVLASDALPPPAFTRAAHSDGEVLVDMQNVNIAYGGRKVAICASVRAASPTPS
jgi:hypothetical protein